MNRKSRRGLDSEDRALWQKLQDSVTPLHGPRPASAGGEITPVPETSAPDPPKPSASVRPFRIGEQSRGTAPDHVLQPELVDRLAAAPLRMDRKRFGRMKKGRLAPEARIDLHGLSLARAQPRLTRFILSAHAAGHRLVLVITGKGRPGDGDGPIPVRRGSLRHALPHWLAMEPVAQLVLQVSEAHRSHGGGGAFYVYLRRRK